MISSPEQNGEFLNKITTGDALLVVPQLEDESVDSVVTDPPYGEQMGFGGDNSLREAEVLLSEFLNLVHPKLKPNAHLAIFFTMRNVDVVIESVKRAGYTFRRVIPMYIPRGGARPYLGWLPRTQAVVLAQKYLPSQPSDFHSHLSRYIAAAIERKGMTRSEVARRLGCDSRLVMKWSREGDPAWCLPTQRFYGPLKELLDLGDEFDALFTREAPTRVVRTDFEYKHDCYVVNEKRFGAASPHPSEKPLSVVEHIVTCVTPIGGTVLDAFSGSGTTALAATRRGRFYIGVELNPEYAEMSRRRIENDQPPTSKAKRTRRPENGHLPIAQSTSLFEASL